MFASVFAGVTCGRQSRLRLRLRYYDHPSHHHRRRWTSHANCRNENPSLRRRFR